ncbi:hypothetical protein J7W08_09725 [Methanococcoides orientis]|uniref:hypothetical protein n=1 Tax=Methanococcoides orientis TaxID=2822137 RepID=UPI001E578BA2|nr:hypothetical protein [Methanococcoides orientis]UGV40350.1 hypothetical protein J7W08_09725 [Methanococcoides orientis]
MIEKLYRSPIAYVVLGGILISAFLFNSMLKFADEGNAVMVILIGISIGIVALFITKAIVYQKHGGLFPK